MIAVRNLTKRYGDVTAVDAISLEIPAGASLGVLGPNGAGKSTLLKMLVGLVHPTAGSAKVCGHDVRVHPVQVLRDAAYLPDRKEVPHHMSVVEFLRFYTSFFPGSDLTLALRLLDEWTIRPDSALDRLSRGQRAKVLLAAVLARRAALTLMDEPSEAVDPEAVDSLHQAMTDAVLSREAGFVLATHRIEDVERMCDRVAIVDAGRLLLFGEIEELCTRWKRVLCWGAQPVERMSSWPGVVSMEVSAEGLAVVTDRWEPRMDESWPGLESGPADTVDMGLGEIYRVVLQRSRGAAV